MAENAPKSTKPTSAEFRKRRTQAAGATSAARAGQAPGSLAEYQSMRDFGTTPEPSGAEGRPAVDGHIFTVQLHHATAVHYDLRLEIDGVLKSWAVPKGPSYDPADKRLAMLTEDHPLAYHDFEGVIPQGHYGAGPMLLWDHGTVEFVEDPKTKTRDPAEQFANGKLVFRLTGTKLNGEWTLVKTKFGGRQNSWLLIKHRDATAREGYDVVAEQPMSIKSKQTIDQIREAG